MNEIKKKILKARDAPPEPPGSRPVPTPAPDITGARPAPDEPGTRPTETPAPGKKKESG